MTHNDLLLLAPFAVASYLADATGQNGADNATSVPRAALSPAAHSPEDATRAPYSLERGVAVIAIEGPLDRHSGYGFFTGTRYALGYDDIARAVNAAAVDPRAKAILLAINSPGGVVAGCKELADHIASVAAQKPMAAYADGLCASAAFWLASATGQILAPRTATVGSIGVIMVHADQSKAQEKAGVKYTYITGGKFKAVGADGPLSDADRDYMTGRVQALHAIFRADVATSLGLDLARADVWGDGQVFVDSEARERGLVTHTVSGLQEAVNRLALEVTMDKTQLAAQHPDLWAEIEKDTAHAVALAESNAKEEGALAERKEILAIVGQLAGEDLVNKIEAVMAAGIMSDQLKAVMEICGGAKAAAPSAQSVSAVDDSRARILAGIEAATPAPLPGAGAVGQASNDDSRAAIERMAAL